MCHGLHPIVKIRSHGSHGRSRESRVVMSGDVTAKWQSDCKLKILYCFSRLEPPDCPGNKFSSFRHLAPLGATWRHLAPLGATWRHLAPLGTFADLCETPSPKFSEGIKPLKQYRKKEKRHASKNGGRCRHVTPACT